MISSERKKLAAKLTAETLNRHQKHWKEWLSTSKSIATSSMNRQLIICPSRARLQDETAAEEEGGSAHQDKITTTITTITSRPTGQAGRDSRRHAIWGLLAGFPPCEGGEDEAGGGRGEESRLSYCMSTVPYSRPSSCFVLPGES